MLVALENLLQNPSIQGFRELKKRANREELPIVLTKVANLEIKEINETLSLEELELIPEKKESVRLLYYGRMYTFLTQTVKRLVRHDLSLTEEEVQKAVYYSHKLSGADWEDCYLQKAGAPVPDVELRIFANIASRKKAKGREMDEFKIHEFIATCRSALKGTLELFKAKKREVEQQIIQEFEPDKWSKGIRL